MSRTLADGTVLEDGPILVTGAAGFVGRHLMYELEMGSEDFATDLTADFEAPAGVNRLAWRLPDGKPGTDRQFRYVIHLAGVSSVANSGTDAPGMYSVNTAGTAAVLDWTVRSSPQARFLLVSSSDVYGSAPGRMSEVTPLRPVTPYGGSKAAAETAANQFSRAHDLDLVIVRPFPHFGPWQPSHFALPSFCRRLIEAGKSGSGSIPVGNLAPVRDYTYIGDVVSAYSILLSRGEGGKVYNVASGEGRSMAEILDLLVKLLGSGIETRPDPELQRKSDISTQIGDASRLASLGWRRKYAFEEGLRILFDWWKERT
jgi:GDP-4-dehydro-6-deoxy-D-mannose reductase